MLFKAGADLINEFGLSGLPYVGAMFCASGIKNTSNSQLNRFVICLLSGS